MIRTIRKMMPPIATWATARGAWNWIGELLGRLPMVKDEIEHGGGRHDPGQDGQHLAGQPAVHRQQAGQHATARSAASR